VSQRRRIRRIIAESQRPLNERVAELTQRAADLSVTARERVPLVDAGFEAFQRELRFGGGLLAGGLAYRLFLWLLPFGLIVSVVLGFWLDYDQASVEDAAEEFGIGAAAVASTEDAVETSQQSGILLLLVGLGLLAWFSLGFVRALQLAYSLAWGVPRPRMRRPLHAVAAFNGLLLLVVVGAAALTWLREALGLGGLVGLVATLALQTAVAVVVMWLLPHRAAHWQQLLPGAALLAVGAQLVQVAVVFYFAPKIGRSSELYGALGTAAVLLVWLYLIARLITSAAFLNVTLWERRHPAVEAGGQARIE
jgi:uncharacterized BrkB/YihY/UPF0761 family membrane protein